MSNNKLTYAEAYDLAAKIAQDLQAERDKGLAAEAAHLARYCDDDNED